MKVLAYRGADRALELWPGAEIAADAKPEPAGYDAVYFENLLPEMTRRQVGGALKLLFDSLKMGGEIVIVVPSLEWACRVIATQDDPPLTAYASLYGDDGEPFLCGFTMRWLRAECERAGFQTVEAFDREYEVQVNGKAQRGVSHVWRGVRPVESAGDAV